MNDTRLIKSIRLRNLLSFGPDSEEIELRPLNVLIGPNSSGKSNFIDAIGLLRATAKDLKNYMRRSGGIKEWLWKGGKGSIATIQTIAVKRPGFTGKDLHYYLDIDIYNDTMIIDEEVIKPVKTVNNEDFFYRFKGGKSEVKVRIKGTKGRNVEKLSPSKDFNENQSILSQLKSITSYPEITLLGRNISDIILYKNWCIGQNSITRIPQKTDLPSAFLSENLDNFALVVDKLTKLRETKDLIKDKLRLFYNEADDVTANIQGGTAQVIIYEGYKDPIPATRLSDGTLRYLCLLTILCHPEPPPLICIEEPEIGLHPDIMPTIAELLIEASKRTQLIVTTHSDVLVSALSETPESILVCEHDDAGTHMRRLEEDKLKDWLEKYSLGDLWLKGEIGGTRW